MAITPGTVIRTELERRGWTQEDLADITGRPLATINKVISGKVQITPETAKQLSVAFGNEPAYWLELEVQYRLSLADEVDASVERKARLFTIAPVKDMEKRGWIAKTKGTDELETALTQFYQVQNLAETPMICAHTRHSANVDTLNPSQVAWCFRAKHLARSVSAELFRKDKFEQGISALRELVTWPEEVRKVPHVLAEMGIRFLVIEPLPHSRIDGAAFWVEDRPVIALSLRFDRIDSFWHTLAHELSHIRHEDAFGLDSEIVGESRHPIAMLDEIEARADIEAAGTFIDKDELEDFIVRVGPLYSRTRINQFANRIHVHPGIIVGQLQHRGEISFGTMKEYLVKVRGSITSEALTDGWGHIIGG